jgi:hypothetical protein
MRQSLPIVLALALMACARPESTPVQDSAAVATPAPAPVAMAPRPPETAAMADTAPVQRTSRTPSRLALDGEGLRIFDAATGASRLIAFGTPAVEAMRMLETVQGGPPSEREESTECGNSFATWPGGLRAWFAQGQFVGWSVAPGDSSLATASGIKVGSTRRELEGAYAAHVARSTLGVEFTAGGLAGLLASADADARVTNLWAGTTCIAR